MSKREIKVGDEVLVWARVENIDSPHVRVAVRNGYAVVVEADILPRESVIHPPWKVLREAENLLRHAGQGISANSARDLAQRLEDTNRPAPRLLDIAHRVVALGLGETYPALIEDAKRAIAAAKREGAQ